MTKKRKPILMVLKTPPPYGGGEIRGAALRDFVRHGSEFIVLEITSGKRDKASQGIFAFWKIVEFLETWIRFIHIVLRQKPSLVFYPMSKSFPHFVRDSIFFWTCRLFGVPFAGELAGASFYFLGAGRIKTWYGKLILTRFACIRVLGKSIAQTLSGYGIGNTVITDNGVEAFPVADDCMNTAGDDIVRLIFIGTHSRQKGFDQLVNACRCLADKGRSFSVHTMGEWISTEFRDDMLLRLDEKRIDEKFTFHGLKHGGEKWAILNQCHILAAPSMMEGQPLAILEAYACGLAVVATNVGAIPDTVEYGKNGYLVSPGDHHELADRLDTLITSPDLRRRMSEENVKLYNQRFTQRRYLQTQVEWLKACADGSFLPRGQMFKVN